nr:hypothetical protein [Mycobacterium sp.]
MRQRAEPDLCALRERGIDVGVGEGADAVVVVEVDQARVFRDVDGDHHHPSAPSNIDAQEGKTPPTSNY